MKSIQQKYGSGLGIVPKYSVATLFLICLGFGTISCAQTNLKNMPETYVAYKTGEALIIDGKANENDWENAKWSSLFMDIEGNRQPAYKTQAKMLWDEDYFYIYAKMEEPHVWATLKKRDTIIFHNNDFEVFIDPDSDTHNYFEIEINALNTVWELFINKPYREYDNVALNDWNITGLQTAVHVEGTLNNPDDNDKYWAVEMAIPFKTFRKSYFEDNVPRNQFWRVNFSRVNWDFEITNNEYSRKKDKNGKYLSEHNWVWSPIGVINMHLPERWGYVYFSTNKVTEKENFTIPKDEEIKWQLAAFYRAQKVFYEKNSTWAKTLDKLLVKPNKIDGKTINYQMDTHQSGFNIWVKSPFSNTIILIKEDGKIIVK
ncbi:MAG: carbohydrate-binding family 9-like protein [Flavobacteriales bacterium]|nr:MAG: carbohydrate-binding family 9-like protein [Flavobacteriales bacterium]